MLLSLWSLPEETRGQLQTRSLIARFQRDCTAQKAGKDGEPLPGEAGMLSVCTGWQLPIALCCAWRWIPNRVGVCSSNTFPGLPHGRRRVLSINCNYVAVEFLSWSSAAILGIKMGTELLNGHGPLCLRAEMVFSLLPLLCSSLPQLWVRIRTPRLASEVFSCVSLQV